MEAARISGRFFYNVGTLEELRGQYRKQVMKYHPDHGGRTEDMQELNAEYDRFLQLFRGGSASEWEQAARERQTTEEEKRKKATEKARRKAAQAEITWEVTPEQLERMNEGEQEAIDTFFSENLHHLYALSRRVLRQYGYRADLKYTNLVELDDLINQAYIDLRSGKVLFDYTRRSISRGLWRSMYYAPVGGAPEDYIYHYKARGGSGTGTRRRRKFAPA